MKYVGLLFWKDFIELRASLKEKKDYRGFISSFLLVLIVYGVFIFVFNAFAQMYTQTDFGDIANRAYRVKELFTLGFTAIFIVNVIVGVKRLTGQLMDSRNNNIWVYQPISAGSLFLYKLIRVYASQVVSTLCIILPMAIVLDTSSTIAGGMAYYFLTATIVILLPLISCAIATLITIPYLEIIRRISSKFIIMLCIYISIVVLGFWLYSVFLNTLSDLIRSGDIKYVFELDTINLISSTCKYLYPSKFFTNILTKDRVFLNTTIVVVTSLIAIVVAYYLIKQLYARVIQKQLEGKDSVYTNTTRLETHSSVYALLHKEFMIVLRTPTYAFQYFAMAITLPFMVYTCSSILKTMIETLTIIDCNYALAIFVVSIFSILTNTFCTTNISRDGKMFAIMKTLPISIEKIVGVKILFCSIVSFVSVLVSCLVLYFTGFLGIEYSFITFVIGFMFSLVQIIYATRKDMKHPTFPTNNQEEITEGNSNMSTLILVGLITTLVTGGGALISSIVLSMQYNSQIAAIVSIGFVMFVATTALIASTIYMFRGLKKRYYIQEI
jgi:ABC-2 type transport system permease protein